MSPWEVGGLSETFEAVIKACAAIELFCKVSGVSAAVIAGCQVIQVLLRTIQVRRDI